MKREPREETSRSALGVALFETPFGDAYDVDPAVDRPEGWPFARHGPTPKGQQQPQRHARARKSSRGAGSTWAKGYLFIPHAVLDGVDPTTKKRLDPLAIRCYCLVINTAESTGVYYTFNEKAADEVLLSSRTFQRRKALFVRLGLLKPETAHGFPFPGRYRVVGLRALRLKAQIEGKRISRFVRIPREWITDPRLSAYELRLLIEYARHQDRFLPDMEIAEACAMSARQVRRCRKWLFDRGYLYSDQGPRKGLVRGIDPFALTDEDLMRGRLRPDTSKLGFPGPTEQP